MRCSRLLPAALLGTAVTAVPLSAQEPAQQPEPLEVGTMAPDFALPGATRYGVLQDSIRLSDFRGKTVVLAFFFKVRTRG